MTETAATSTALERVEPVHAGMTAFELAPTAWALAQRVARTEFVPEALRGKPEAVLACILAGHEVGVGPMQALSKIHVIKGRPTMAAELMRAIVLREGHELWIEESTITKCTLVGKRRNSTRESRVSWSMDDAKRAKLEGRDNWVAYPRAMLLARATGELCRAIFADVLGGISYTFEELEDGDVFGIDADIVAANFVEETLPESAGGAPAPAGPATARADRPATRGAPSVGGEPEPTVGTKKAPEPPLPGEDDDEIVDAVVVQDGEYEGPDTHTEHVERTYTAPQVIAMRCTELGLDRAAKLWLVAKIVGHDVATTVDLEADEVTLVLEVLGDVESVREILAEREATATVPEREAPSEASPAASSSVPVAEPEPAPPRRRRRVEEGSTAVDPDRWTADDWRSFLQARKVKVSEVLREANRLARERDEAPPSTLDALVGSTLAVEIVGFVEDLAQERGAES